MQRIYLIIAIFTLSLICCLTACTNLEYGNNNNNNDDDDIIPPEPIQNLDTPPL